MNNAANTIVAQLGNVTLSMLGASMLMGGENHLQFRIKGSRKANCIRIELDPSDTYTVKFYKINSRTYSATLISEVSDVYADSLKPTITAHTGLYTTLS